MSSVCRVCFQEGQNRRVLPCLHSFCASCIDRLISTEFGGEKLKCPVCRSWVRVPDNGAAGLPKDVTQPDDVKELHCETCTLKVESGAPTLWCVTCKVALCSGHVAHHLTSGSGKHVIEALSETGSAHTDPDSSDRMSQCPEHDSPLEFYCSACDVAVCGRCAVIGAHHGHAGIAEMKDREQQIKRKVQDKVEKLKDNLPRVEAMKEKVEVVNDDLSARAKKARDKVRAAEKRVVDTVHAVAEQKVQDIDDLEPVRHKALDEQLDQLKDHAERLKAAVTLTDKLVQRETTGQDVVGLLQAIDEQAAALAQEGVPDDPAHHSRLVFEPLCEDELISMAGEMLGHVMPCDATADASYLVGDRIATVHPNEMATFALQACSEYGDAVEEGEDVVRVELSSFSIHNNAAKLSFKGVFSKPGGRFEIACTPQIPGWYFAQVKINEEEFGSLLFVHCQGPDPWFYFDESECQAGLAITPDKQSVKYLAGDPRKACSVLGSSGRSYGRHTWCVKIGAQTSGKVGIGVAKRPGLTETTSNYMQSYMWTGHDGLTWEEGEVSTGVSKFSATMCFV